MYCPRCGKEMRRSDRDNRYMVCDNCKKKFFRPIEDSYEEDELSNPGAAPAVQEKRSICTVIALVLSLAYLVYLAYYWVTAAQEYTTFASQAGFQIAKGLVMPHIIATAIGFVFNAVGVILPNRWFVLVGAIVYSVAIVLFPVYFMFLVLQVILSFVGFGLMVAHRNSSKQI